MPQYVEGRVEREASRVFERLERQEPGRLEQFLQLFPGVIVQTFVRHGLDFPEVFGPERAQHDISFRFEQIPRFPCEARQIVEPLNGRGRSDQIQPVGQGDRFGVSPQIAYVVSGRVGLEKIGDCSTRSLIVHSACG